MAFVTSAFSMLPGMQGTVEIRGLAQLNDALLALPRNVQRNVLRRSLYRAAVPMRARARQLAPVFDPSKYPKGSLPSVLRRVKPGLLRKSLQIVRGRLRPDGSMSAYVSIKRLSAKQIRAFRAKTGKAGRANPDDPFYWQIFEFGKLPRTKRPFIRPAFEQTKDISMQIAVAEIERGVVSEIAKLAWKGVPR